MTTQQKHHRQSALSDCIPDACPGIVIFRWRRLVPTHSTHCWICQPASLLKVCPWGRWLAGRTSGCSTYRCSRWRKVGDEWYYTMRLLKRGWKKTCNRLRTCILAKQNSTMLNIIEHFCPPKGPVQSFKTVHIAREECNTVALPLLWQKGLLTWAYRNVSPFSVPLTEYGAPSRVTLSAGIRHHTVLRCVISVSLRVQRRRWGSTVHNYTVKKVLVR